MAADFNLQALYAALDEQRQARELSWSAVMREVTGSDERPRRQLSQSTVARLRTATIAEGDGVLQMLRWLGRTPESFVPGRHHSEDARFLLPRIRSRQTLRFDTKKLYAALDAQRRERRLTWREVAKETVVAVSSLTHLAKGGRTAFPAVMRMVGWLNCPAAYFTRASDW